MPIIIASILDADWLNLRAEIESVEEAGVSAFSIDVMDGHFAPRITFGPQYVAQIRQWTDLPIETHLMIDAPADNVEIFCDAGADQVTFHLEASENPHEIVDYVHSRGLLAGIAIQVETELDAIEDSLLRSVDTINVMAVPIGFGGASLGPETERRVRELRSRAESLGTDLVIEVDGGVKPAGTGALVASGADLLVIGTGIYKAKDYSEAVKQAQSGLGHPPVHRPGLKRFLACPSRELIDDTDRRARLDALRERLDIPTRVWDPLNSAR